MLSSLKPSSLTFVSLIALGLTLFALWSLHVESQEFSHSPRKLEWQQPKLFLCSVYGVLILIIVLSLGAVKRKFKSIK